MVERQQCEFHLIRYVPDAVKNEFVNIGLVMRRSESGERAVVRFTRDWSRVRCIDPDADIELLEALEMEIGQRLLEEAADAKPILSTLQESFSNALQITEAKACLAETFPAELEQLMRLYVDTAKRGRETRRAGRQSIQASMRRQFERAGVWSLMRRQIAAANYTRPGDPLRIDCGYRPNGLLRMFQAVSLDGDLEASKVLAFSAGPLREGVARVEQATLELTAVVEPLRRSADDEPGEDRIAQYRFAVETMEQHEIRVLTTSDLPRVADAARRELRL